MEFLADPIFLSRFQMAFTLAFHILFPTLTIGLSLFLVVLHGLWLRTHDHAYMLLFRFWMKIFGLAFGVGVVSGIVLSFEFGTNFNGFSRVTGNVLAPLLSYEVLMAFFLEASFLPILLFGWGKVGPRVHFFSTVMVAVGTVLSAFWILSANSWMHTPVGFTLRDEIFFANDWWTVVFNPSFPYRLAHMLNASLLTVAFVVAGVAAWYLLRGRHIDLSRRTLSMAMWTALIVAPGQVLLGDLHGLNTLEHQPVKIAAMEGLWETRGHAPFVVFGIPDSEREENRYALEIPGASSFILKHDPGAVVQGLSSVNPDERPPVGAVFWSFRVMLYAGFLLLALALIGTFLRVRRRLYDSRWFLQLLVAASPLGFVAVIAGWFVTEIGRQPWVVQGLLRTIDSATPIPLSSVAGSVVMFLVVYHLLLGAFLFFLYRLVQRGPDERVPSEGIPGAPRTAWFPSAPKEG
ncbi:cytochrome ubiquinol oxidase subunit I [Thiohalomonas denitrificans]|uniref:cytochrome ubiquinol oxidase subunit I n=1 Tax=Thiohalomonas denitrificans TaxID=415747 RepID=UPI0026EDD3A0|nr:cytochrome ubiquinol oxidase subunit I [Thiohalomonas denitrificans]